jgi:hypothetical protein
MPLAAISFSHARCCLARAMPGSLSAPATDKRTMCFTPARFAAATACIVYPCARSEPGVSMYSFSAPSNAGTYVPKSSQSKRTASAPRPFAFSGARAPIFSFAPAPCSALTVVAPTVPVAPSTRIIGGSPRWPVRSSLNGRRLVGRRRGGRKRQPGRAADPSPRARGGAVAVASEARRRPKDWRPDSATRYARRAAGS